MLTHSENWTFRSPIVDRDAKQIANSFFEQLQKAGLGGRDVLCVTNQLISMVTDQMARDGARRSQEDLLSQEH